MIDGKILTEKLIKYALTFLDMEKRDEIYFRNLLLREFNEDVPFSGELDLSYIEELTVPDELVSEIEQFGRENEKIEAGLENLYSTYIMGLISPLPSKVNQRFNEIKKSEGIEKACEYFYNLSVKNNYVQKTAIERNLKWDYIDGDKTLEITINLSKPEKDNKEIAKLVAKKPTTTEKYPACFLCKENEGFKGSATHPARENIRTISLTMGEEPWFVQYSPYAYYNEHMIAISEAHTPMHIEDDTIDKLVDFVEFFPNYMIGSNAALPIIGGSILNHEHFQGGEHLMPMHHAPLTKEFGVFKNKKYKKVKVGIVDWYNSVIRLESTDRKQISDFAKEIIAGWKAFSDEQCGIVNKTGDVPHNSVAPVLRKSGKKYIFDLILRNNITSEQYPDGVFHAHPEYHNIKKEGIGLIEAMGLFILPGRLKRQLNDIADILCGNAPYSEEEISNSEHPLYVHREMIKSLYLNGIAKNKEEAEARVTDRVNEICRQILFNTSVFKKDEQGNKGFVKFLNSVNVFNK